MLCQTYKIHFSSVFVEEGDGPVPEFITDFTTILEEINVSDADMLKVLNSLKTSKSPGPDTIHPRILKELSSELAPPLRMLFTKTFNDGKLPDAWKEAEGRSNLFLRRVERIPRVTTDQLV